MGEVRGRLGRSAGAVRGASASRLAGAGLAGAGVLAAGLAAAGLAAAGLAVAGCNPQGTANSSGPAAAPQSRAGLAGAPVGMQGGAQGGAQGGVKNSAQDAGDPAIPKPVAGAKPCPGLHSPLQLTLNGRPAVEVQTKMDVDVDGAPNAYGPRGKPTLDVLEHALSPKDGPHPGQVVGFMTEYDGGPPTVQRADDPYPGYYVSQTDFADKSNTRMEDPRRYVDAGRINYVVEGDVAERAGVRMGDFVSVYSCRTGRSVYAIVADSGNASGAEGSLALVQALGYRIYDGKEESVNDKEIVIRYFPKSNADQHFFRSQAEIDAAAAKLGIAKY